MRRYVLLTLLVCLGLSATASATMVHQDWNEGVGASRQAIIDFLVDLVNPVPVPDLEEIIDESAYVGSKDNYVAKFYGWVTVPVTGDYQFHYSCDDYGMLYVSQDEEMANAVEVAYVDGWAAIAEWNKYPSQHSEVMSLRAGQVMAVMAFFQEAGGGDNMDIGWTGPPPLSSDITAPTYLTDYITHIPPTPTRAKNPSPDHEAIDIPRDVVMSWGAGKFAASHDVYLGTVFEDVNSASRSNPLDVLVSQGQTAATYDPPGLLDFGTTYYWRIDEVNAAPDNTIFKGEVWRFTSEPFAYPVENIVATTNGLSDEGSGPERTIDGSGLNAADQHSVESLDMWLASAGEEPLYIQYEFDRVYKLDEMLVWNYNVMFELLLGFGIQDVTIEYSEDGVDWTVLGDETFAQATAKATYEANTSVDFGGVAAKFVRINVNSGFGGMGQYGLSEVRFLYIPAHAREPQPADGATDVEVGTSLSWRSGREAASHDVYLGTDPNAVPLVDSVGPASYTPGDLEFGSTYYWQIVEVNEADEISAWASDVWTFSTEEYALIDGFETYDDDIEAGTAIFDTWLDGWVNETGSTVGYFDAPFAEKSIVRSGSQSMPIQYDNSESPFNSEAERIFDSAQDWTGNGAETLVLYVRGNAPDFVEAADGSIVMSAIGTDIWDVADQFRFAYKNLAGNGSITVRVDSLIRSNEWAKAGVMIRETLEPGSKHAFAAATPEPAHGLSFQRRPVAGQVSDNTDVADVEIPHWVRLTRTGNVFTMEQSEDGVTWVEVTPPEPVDIQMSDSVYIGLAVTSHDAGIVTAAEFSGLTMTGNVSGDWQTAEVGVDQPMGNSSEPMYVRLEDASGKSVTVMNPDDAITVRPSWQEWAIPYSDLAGVNLSRIEKMVIGVGDASSPSAGGSGTVYVDDVGFGRAAAE